MTDIVWEDPPVSNPGRPPGKHAAIAAELRRNPGHWAKVITGSASSLAGDIQRARYAPYRPPGSFEAVSRNSRSVNGRTTRVADIYARYVGDPTT